MHAADDLAAVARTTRVHTRAGARLPVACVCIAAAIALFFALLAPRADAAVGPISGVAVHPWDFESGEPLAFWPLRDPAVRDRSFAALKQAGVRRARVDLRWSVVEPFAKGVQDWSEFDAVHRSAVAHGIQLIPVIAFTPRWANGSNDHWRPPRNAADYGDFVAAALQRYPDIADWEIWNEANLGFFWRPHPDVRGFVALLRAAHEARDRVGSHAKLISGGLSSTGEDPLRWFDEMARLGAFAYVDGFALHPYSRTRPPDHPKSYFLKVPEFRRRLVRLGRSEIGIWLTEYGTPNTTAPSDNYGAPISADQQAENLGRAFTLASLWPYVANLSWYELQEACGDSRDPNCRFGLFNRNFAPKPAFGRLRTALAGHMTRLRSDLTLHARNGRRVRVRGKLTRAGLQGADGVVRIKAKSGGRTRSVKTNARRGSFAASLGLGPGRWRIVASVAGTKLHRPAKSPTVILSR